MAGVIFFTAVAQREIDESTIWYESKRIGLGVLFIGAVGRLVNQIAANPETFGVKKSGYREAKLPRFPYVIIYEQIKKTGEIWVHHVFHTKRNPRKKRETGWY